MYLTMVFSQIQLHLVWHLPYLTPRTNSHKLLQAFPDITRQSCKETTIKYIVAHQIYTTGPPVISRARILAPDGFAIAKAEVDLASYQQWALSSIYGPYISYSHCLTPKYHLKACFRGSLNFACILMFNVLLNCYFGG